MVAQRLTLAAIFALAALAAAEARAKGPQLAFCGGPEGGVQARAVEQIGRRAEKSGLAVRKVETEGSLDNLAHLARGDCEAAVVRLDALMVYSMASAGRRLKIAAPIHLFDERLYLVCRRQSGIGSVADLLREAERYTVLTGEPGGGSETTWRALTDLDMDLPKIGTRALGGRAALAVLLSDESADCMTVLAADGAAILRQLARHGDALCLVPVDLFEFRDPEMVDNRIYRSVSIPAGTYGALQAKPDDPETETISVSTMVITAKAWARAEPEAHRRLRRAIAEAKPDIAGTLAE